MSYFSRGHGKITGLFLQVKCTCIPHTLFSRCFLQAAYWDWLQGGDWRMAQEKGHVQWGARRGLGGCLGEGMDFQIFQFSLLCHIPSARAKGPAFLFPIPLCLQLLGNKYIGTDTDSHKVEKDQVTAHYWLQWLPNVHPVLLLGLGNPSFGCELCLQVFSNVREPFN